MKPRNLFQTSAQPLTPDALAALEKAGHSRRDFLKTAGVMVVGFSAATRIPAQSPIAPDGTIDATQLDSWVAIGADESVTCYTGKCELGHGMRTVQYQLIAEELSVPLSRIELIMCITGITPDQGSTVGSQSTITEFGAAGLRAALDTARDALMQLAAEQLDTTVDQLGVTDGVVWKKSDPSQQVSYGQLIFGKRFNLTLNQSAVPKDPSKWTVLGTSVPRLDIPAKATGQFQYVHHVRLPGMLHGRVVRPPTVGAHVVSVDKSSVASLPGKVQVVVVKDFVGVVADTEWHAIQAAGALSVQWSPGDTLPDQASLYTWMPQQPTADSYQVNSQDVDQTLAKATTVLKATYLHPYQMHGSLGSSCAVADVRGGMGKSASAKVWSATQGIYPHRDSLATLLGIPAPNVQVIFVDGSGCYGFNGADMVGYDAALMSQAVGAPVRVQYSRRDEHAAGESYGPAVVVNVSAGLDQNGQMIGWDFVNWYLNKGGRPNATTPGNILPGALAGFPTTPLVPGGPTQPSTFSNGNNNVCNYVTGMVNGVAGGTGTVASQRVLNRVIYSPFWTGPLRSPNRLQNTFANECFMDEIAASLKIDPIQYRIRHLADARLIAALNSVAQAARWDTRPSPKPSNPKTGVVTGRGVSCVLYEGNNGYCAMVVEVSVDQDSGVVTVTRIVTSQDSGPVSNPDGLRNQMEGGALQGMSRALYEQVNWNSRAGIITSTDWNSYPVFRWGDPVPVIETVVINTLNAPSKGSGECTITLAAAAIGNAIFDATGVRVRQVPFTPANFMAAQQGS